MTDETEPIDATQVVNRMRRTTKEIFNRGASEERGLQLAKDFADLDEHIIEGGYLPHQWRNVRRGRPREEEDGEVLDFVQHGTRSGYNAGCHCQKCRKANREHSARRRAKQKEQSA